VSHVTDDTLELRQVSSRKNLTEQSIFDLVAKPGQNKFGAQIVTTLQSSAGPLQIDCVSSHVTSCLQQQLTFQPVRDHLQRIDQTAASQQVFARAH